MAEFSLVILVSSLAIGASFVLYYFIRAEHDQRETMNRETAEQAARQDTKHHK